MSHLHWMMLYMYAMGIIAGTYLPRLAGDVRRKYRRSKLQRLIWQARHPRYVRGVNTHMREFGHYPLTRTPALDDWDCLRCEDDNPCDDACDNTCCADCRYDLGGEG